MLKQGNEVQMKKGRGIAWALAFLCLSIPLSSLSQISFKQISKNEGLSHNNVEAIIQDGQGIMWFGTRDGLCRYDGYEVVVMRNTADHQSISGNRIMSLAEGLDGQIWVGTYQNGLNRYNNKKNVFDRFGEEQGIGNQINRIKVLKNGLVLIGSNNGLAVFNTKNDSIQIYTANNSPNSLNSNIVSDILETKDGKIWIATWEQEIQIFNYKNGRFASIRYLPKGKQAGTYRKRMLEDENGNIWIAAQMHGFCKYDPKTKKTIIFEEGSNQLNTDILNGDMILTPDKKIWISTDIGGINVFDPKTESFEYILNKKDVSASLPSDHIYTLYIDQSNRIWVGTFDQGVAYYDPLMDKFKNTNLPEDVFSFFKGKSVISVLQDDEGNIWIGTDGQGLHRIDKREQISSFYYNEEDLNSLSTNVITSLAEDKAGNILIGTYSGGLNVYSPKTNRFQRFRPNLETDIHSDNVWSILTDSNDRIWLGLLGNGADLFSIENQTFKNVGPFSNDVIQVDHSNVMCLLEDADGDIWFGTEGRGIFVFDKQAYKTLRMNTIPDNSVIEEGIIKDLFQDSRGIIWIATEGNGLFKYNKADKNLIEYTKNDGLPGMIIMGIQEDNSGNIWVSTYDGLALYREGIEQFTSFYSYDGLSSNEFNAEAFIKLSDGSFLLGSIDGIDIFDPLSIRFNQNIPRILFTKFSIFNQQVSAGDTLNKQVFLENDILHTESITLTHREKVFSIEFAAVNMTHPQKCQYRYMLEGFNEDWISTKVDHRFASYSNLNNGIYVFKVQASNNDGKWGNNIAELQIKILRPWWESFWFIMLVSFVGLCLIYLLYSYRMQRVKAKFLQEKARSDHRILELEKENIETELEKLAYHTVQRNRDLIDYKNRLSGLSSRARESVKKGLSVVIEEIDKEIASEKEWKYIEPRLDKLHNNFITKLREAHPDLTLSEIKVAAYVRMNLSSKEIAEFMHKTIRAVENDRYRLRKKLNLASNESLQSYLVRI